MNLIKRLISYKKKFSTYSIGLLQAKSYRILKKKTTAFLSVYDLSTVDWALLGILYETSEETLYLIDIADALGVKPPFVTRIIAELQKRGLVTIEKSNVDSRAKNIHLTKEGSSLVVTIERKLRVVSRTWITGVSPLDFLAYMRVLEAISQSEEKE